MVLVGEALYDVTDPVHPRLLCEIRNTVAHLFTTDTFEYLRPTSPSGTEVVLHSIGSGNESVVAGWPLNLHTDSGSWGDWTADGNNAATFEAGTDASGNATIQVWLFSERSNTELYEFPSPATDCICRFGLPQPVLAFSADGQFLVSGWPIGKGATPLRVYRVSDRTWVQTMAAGEDQAFWSHTGHRLYLAPRNSLPPRAWSPEGGFAAIGNAVTWAYAPSLSPDEKQVAYTAFAVPANFAEVSVYFYDFARDTSPKAVDLPRSEITFVKDGWVWYWDEVPCTSNCASATQSGTRLFAMQLSTGVEHSVVFATGESPVDLKSGWGPGQFWPNS